MKDELDRVVGLRRKRVTPCSLRSRLLASTLIPLTAFSTWTPLLTSGCNGSGAESVGNADLSPAVSQDSDGLSDAGGAPSQQQNASALPEAEVEISATIPENGRFDLFHRISGINSGNSGLGTDGISASVYAMRTLVVKDLLKTRASLKAMMGGTERARQVTENNALTFSVPASVKQLYLLGPNGDFASNRVHSRAAAHAPSEGAAVVTSSSGADPRPGQGTVPASGPLREDSQTSPRVHGFESELEFPDIARSIAWVENTEITADADFTRNRLRLAAGLIYLSANLARLDRHLKYIDEDYWQHPEIRRQFRAAESGCISQNSEEADEESGFEFCRGRWMQRHGMDRVRERILALRAMLAERYNILSVDVGSGEWLYQAIYSRMVMEAGFPSSTETVRPTSLTLPSGTQPIALSSTFEDRIDAALNALAEPNDRARLERIVTGNSGRTAIGILIDRALGSMLAANTASLNQLCGTVDYRPDPQSPLVQLGRYPDLWEAARNYYRYLGPLIDFDSAQAAFNRYFREDEGERRTLRYATYAGVIGLTVAALFSLGATLFGAGGLAAAGGTTAVAGGTTAAGSGAVAGTAASASTTFMGLSAGTWVTGAALGTTGLAGYGYYRSRNDARSSESLFLGGQRSGNSVVAGRDRVMSQQDYHLLLASATHLMFSIPWLEGLVAVARPLGEGVVNSAVALAQTERGVHAAQWLAAQSARVTRLSRLFPGLNLAFRDVLRMAEGPLGLTSGTFVSLEQGINALVATSGLSRASLMTRLGQIPVIAPFVRAAESGAGLSALASRVFVRSGFLRYLINEEISDVMVSVPVQLLNAHQPIDYSSPAAFMRTTSQAGVWRNLQISMTEVGAMASIVYLPVMRRAYRAGRALPGASPEVPNMARPAGESADGVRNSSPPRTAEGDPHPAGAEIDSTLPPTIFDPNLDRAGRIRIFARNASMFGLVGFSSGFLGTMSTNATDSAGQARGLGERLEQASWRGLFEMGFFALNANAQMQFSAFINSRLMSIARQREARMNELRGVLQSERLNREMARAAQRELTSLENGRIIIGPAPTAVSAASDTMSWWQYVTLLHWSGMEERRSLHPIRGTHEDDRSHSEMGELENVRIEQIGRAYLRRTDRGDLLQYWFGQEGASPLGQAVP